MLLSVQRCCRSGRCSTLLVLWESGGQMVVRRDSWWREMSDVEDREIALVLLGRRREETRLWGANYIAGLG
jgi:hypothetical protein